MLSSTFSRSALEHSNTISETKSQTYLNNFLDLYRALVSGRSVERKEASNPNNELSYFVVNASFPHISVEIRNLVVCALPDGLLTEENAAAIFFQNDLIEKAMIRLKTIFKEKNQAVIVS